MPSSQQPVGNRPSLVSVIVPAYNAGLYLAETLDSVLASDYPALEIVIVDDGSTDDTLAVARRYEAAHEGVRVVSQPNGGVCRARNQAILHSHGTYLLPLDADDKIEPGFIRDAVAVLEADAEVKAVVPGADFFGDRSGEWRLPEFSIRLLARKNILANCALFRRADWDRTEGYCEEIIAREDWEFWIALLKNGGRLVKLPGISLHYRFHKHSKRTSDRQLKAHVIRTLNRRHPEFFERELNGPLRRQRTWSRLINGLYRLFHPRRVVVHPDYRQLEYLVRALPAFFRYGSGRVIYDGRNQLCEFHWGDADYVVKSYCAPNFINRIAYGIFRSSKAQRSYEYAGWLRACGIGSPAPVAWMTERSGLLLRRSYYVSLKSALPYTYQSLIGGNFPEQEKYLRAIARTTAALHENGMVHKDYSRGNILFGDGPDGVAVEIIDLNRIRFHRHVSMEEGCRNFAERLPATDAMRRIMAQEYAAARGFDAAACERLMAGYNKEKS